MPWLEKSNHARTKRDTAKQKLREWQQVRRQVLERDGHRCRACGLRQDVDVHHRLFRSRGGANTLPNLLALCRICHGEIHAYRLSIVGENANRTLRFVRRG